MKRINFKYLPFIMLALLALVAGVFGGLGRMGMKLPHPMLLFAAFHAPLMVGGFLGTLITLERAVALEKKTVFLLPALSGIGAAMFWLEVFPDLGVWFIIASSIGLVLVYGYIMYRQPSVHTIVMGLGAILWVSGNILWKTGYPFGFIADQWAGFLILTVVGERIELSRFVLSESKPRKLIVAITLVYLAGLYLSMFVLYVGVYIIAISLVLMSFWLFSYDLARFTIKTQGLTKFMAVCLLTGFAWMAVSGVFTIVYLYDHSHLIYDAMLHAIFLGFIFSMIFAHAPVIFTSIIGKEMEYSDSFYIHYAILHISLVIRIVGDVSGMESVRLLGGILNGIAILVFIINIIMAVMASKKKRLEAVIS